MARRRKKRARSSAGPAGASDPQPQGDEAGPSAVARLLLDSSWLPVTIIFLLAALARLISVTPLLGTDNPLNDVTVFPDGDLYENLQQAREIVERGGTPEGHFIHGALYVYIVAGALKVFGGQYGAVYVFQLFLGCAAAAVIFLATRILFGTRAAWIAGAAAGLYAPSMYYETVLSSDSTITMLVGLLLWLAALHERGAAKRWWALPVMMGIVLGILTLMRANLCLLGLALAAASVLAPAERPFRRRVAGVAIVAALSIAVILPACIWNTRQAGAPRFVVGESDVIWKFAWSVDSPGYFRYPKGFPNDNEMLDPVSRPAARLALKKAFQYFAWFEFADMTNFHLYAKLSRPLDWNPLTFRILSPLGLLGLLIAMSRFRGNALPCFFFFVILGAAVLFYISGRYRLAILPLMFAFAGHGIDSAIATVRSAKEDRASRLRLAGMLAAAALLFASVNLYDPSKLFSQWHSDIIFGNYVIQQGDKAFGDGDFRGAEKYGRRLLWLANPTGQLVGHRLLAQSLARLGDREAAAEHARRAQALGAQLSRNPVAVDEAGRETFAPSL